ncbi:phosphoadenylyl-sulfate reductase [Blastochloris viridis]|uniref:Adenosine 5'-phosphosulfate reductase n=1 Tax=Blastochloris viridis TaxID=1079 RepID=A0A0H5BDI9_BLAVI|nr:phosphoadenylyl-sulfate reductase [Blastochloris viridis]ALK09825.1 Phosphoadenosine phosphosulfate reductase [Blastochloris viridis]BAS00271.1 thioredoxin [Blastochloris viridis]CUU42488.1 Phosphoadenosine phosphosulfate reductase [Blastochloris viridis]
MPTLDDVAALESRFGRADAASVLAAALARFKGEVAVVSSFGAESAVLLHLVAEIDPATPVLFVDTGRHFPETLAYRDALTSRLGLKDVRSVAPAAEEVAQRDPEGTRAVWDPDGCCAFRKVAPLERALSPFAAWITGRKRYQAETRTVLPTFELDDGRIKVNPLATWRPEHLAAYAGEHRLPQHPLVARGYPSIGCAPCTRPASHDAPRAGRWAGFDKTECGIHGRTVLPATSDT